MLRLSGAPARPFLMGKPFLHPPFPREPPKIRRATLKRFCPAGANSVDLAHRQRPLPQRARQRRKEPPLPFPLHRDDARRTARLPHEQGGRQCRRPAPSARGRRAQAPRVGGLGALFRSDWGGEASRRRQAHEQGPAACGVFGDGVGERTAVLRWCAAKWRSWRHCRFCGSYPRLALCPWLGFLPLCKHMCYSLQKTTSCLLNVWMITYCRCAAILYRDRAAGIRNTREEGYSP